LTEKLQIRIHGPAAAKTLIYLPGLHGDWTLIGGFRNALRNRVRFVETTYPRTLAWSLDDYAAGIEAGLESAGITSGWLLGESFASQVVWALAARKRFNIEGIVLAGGFVRYPIRAGVQLVEWIGGRISLRLIVAVLFGYSKIARWRFRNSPATAASIQEFIDRRTELDRQAAMHRLRLIAANNPCAVASKTQIPVYAISGFMDPVVPWFFVRRWLRRNCPAFKEYRVVRGADHNVLSTAPRPSTEQILRWMQVERSVENPASRGT